MSRELSCFKAYDVRGRIPDQLNEDIARRIGRGFARVIKPRTVVVSRRSSEASSPCSTTSVSTPTGR